jgi:hypothetical protein
VASASTPSAAIPLNRVLTAAERSRLIQQILTEHPLKFQTSRDGREDLCPPMFDALRSGHGLTFLEPTFRTEDPEDPRFEKYNNCKQFNWQVAAQLQFNGVAAIGVRHFALYDLEEESAEGLRPFELIYAEASPAELDGSLLGGYKEIDLKACAFKGGVSIDQSADLAAVSSNYPTSVNALLQRQGQYFVVEIVDYRVPSRRKPDDAPLYSMQVFQRDSATGYFQGICAWIEPVPENLK